ncbi:MAG TPA: hypothetical protein VLM85_08665 [Polyangiaceae bacterium]|nr:hypothetical protein [Polyangiaceae bacterium]
MLRVFVSVASALVLSAAWARAEDPAAAEVLFREGRSAAEAGDYAAACPKFEESYRLDPAPGTLLNLGDCEENRGQLARAWQHFRRLDDQLPPTDVRKPLAAARAHALELRTPKLRIVMTSSVAATLVRDDVPLGAASLGTKLPVDPGRHVVVVTSAGRRDRRYEISLAAGDDKELWVSVGEPLPRAAFSSGLPFVGGSRSGGGEGSEGGGRRTAAFVLGGLGFSALVPGAIFAGLALSDMTGRPSTDQLREAQAFAIAADVTLGAGVILVGTALVLVLSAPQHHARRSASALPWSIRF